MAITAFETVCDVAVVRAVFSVVISVGRERLPAAGAGEGLKGFTVDLVQMGVPPVSAAGIGAELHRLAARCLGQWLATITAAVRFWFFFYMYSRFGAGQIASAAEGGHLVFRQAQRGSNGGIPVSVLS